VSNAFLELFCAFLTEFENNYQFAMGPDLPRCATHMRVGVSQATFRYPMTASQRLAGRSCGGVEIGLLPSRGKVSFSKGPRAKEPRDDVSGGRL